MRPQTERTHQERMLAVLVYIQAHLDEALSLDELAEIACFSPYHLHRIFQGMTGETLMAHVRRLRLERAAVRLKHTDMPVTRIAFEAGYETHEAFTRAFRAMFAVPPARFRERHQPLPWPEVPSGVHYGEPGGLENFTPQTGGQDMEAEIKTIEPTRVAFVRHVGPYNEVGPTWGTLCAWAGRKGLFGANTRMFGVCHDDPQVTPPDKIRYDACIVVDEKIQPEGEIGVQMVGGGEYASTVHRGPYEGLAKTYAELCGQWVPTQGREVASAPSIEEYKNNPQTTPPEQLLTEVYVPLEAKA
jgi:AraC family transcriptional regulator